MKYADDLSRVVALTLCSAYVAGDKPLSILIISDRPEAGKTKIVQKFSGTPFVEFASDITGFGIKRDFAEAVMAGKLNHIIIPEFLQPLMKGKVSAQSFTTTLQVMMEDGWMGSHTGFVKQQKMAEGADIKTVGFIGCLPRPLFTRQIRYEWAKTGFLSRWLIITYKYGEQAVDAIIDSIEKGDYLKTEKEGLKFDGNMVDVKIPETIAKVCSKMGLDATQEAREAGLAYGFREIKHIRSLVASLVIYDRIVNGSTRSTATMADCEEVDRLGYLFNENFNEVKQ